MATPRKRRQRPLKDWETPEMRACDVASQVTGCLSVLLDHLQEGVPLAVLHETENWTAKIQRIRDLSERAD